MLSIYNSANELREMLFGEKHLEQSHTALNEAIRTSLESGKITVPPRYLMLKVTNYCNSNCCYCGHAVSRSAQEIKSEVSFDVLQRTVQQAAELGVYAATMTGGEPLLRDDMPALAEYMLSKGIVPVLLTNALLLPKKWEELGEAGLRYLIISIDSLDPETYRLQRGAELAQALQGLRAAQAMRERFGDVKLHVTTVITRHNIAELPFFVRAMSQDNIAVQFSPYHHYFHGREDVLSPKDEVELKASVGELLQMKREGYLIAGTTEYISQIPDFFLRRRVPEGYRCLTGYLAMFVDAYSNVRPCWSSCFEPVGNLAEQSLSDIWYGDVYAQDRKKMFHCACEGCWYLCTGELTTLCNEGGCIYERAL